MPPESNPFRQKGRFWRCQARSDRNGRRTRVGIPGRHHQWTQAEMKLRFRCYPIPALSSALGPSRRPSGMATVLPAPSWSVLLQRMLTRRPSGTRCRSADCSATSSERRKPPPCRITAWRSRTHCADPRRRCSATFRAAHRRPGHAAGGARPWPRRIPTTNLDGPFDELNYRKMAAIVEGTSLTPLPCPAFKRPSASLVGPSVIGVAVPTTEHRVNV